MKQHRIQKANVDAARTVEEVRAAGKRLGDMTDYSDRFEQYDSVITNIRTLVEWLRGDSNCSTKSYHRDLVHSELDDIARLDEYLAEAASTVKDQSAALVAAQQGAQAAYDMLKEAISALPPGVDPIPHAQ
jgi:ferritin